ncbi:MAG: hypothetical protein JJE22_06345 [Bacteroidia bacterium]|nr:hypothetical protein [Bacteroidia bacterium]
MINFFQVLFLVASIVLLVLNVLDYNKYVERKKHPGTPPYPIKWFYVILTTLVALGCAINIIVRWIIKG